ncbi:ATP synthase F0, A subunit [Aeromicrobium marinum DSM 15272]|uniref:ATP synthase subunit a n=1 Tax=Aeromicrobium marinum DSM 15272 TaxID=585531 RepID=E2SCR5_9ACTN|nr:F0F1 ATP synthase subunit A [Aeromicrobium marinum]EFQ83018.1 ATP synthase F0, A subunit [Aeromicrobium marinum DSM 15272]
MTFAWTTFAAVSEPPSPGPADFNLPPIFEIGEFGVTKPMVLVVLSAVIAFGVMYAMARQAAVVPSRMQFAGESVYGFVKGVARDNIGSAEYMKYVPYLFTIFLFVLVNNYFGIIPFIQFPTMSRIGYVVAIAGIAWLVYNIAGIIKHGFFGYLKHQTVPAGIDGPILVLLVPLEFFSNIVVRPFTLILRLFATMFAGHLLLILFALGGEYLLLSSDNAFAIPGGILSVLMAIVISFLEMLIMFLQAYVFTLLTAMYIGTAISEEH